MIKCLSIGLALLTVYSLFVQEIGISLAKIFPSDSGGENTCLAFILFSLSMPILTATILIY